jgi:hypothetical protein
MTPEAKDAVAQRNDLLLAVFSAMVYPVIVSQRLEHQCDKVRHKTVPWEVSQPKTVSGSSS